MVGWSDAVLACLWSITVRGRKRTDALSQNPEWGQFMFAHYDDTTNVLIWRDVNASKIYELPTWIPPDTHWLISRMLIVDPVRRITVPDILAHPWTRRGMKQYMLGTLRSAPSMVGTVTSLLNEMKNESREITVDGMGAVEMGIVDGLAMRLGIVRVRFRFLHRSVGINSRVLVSRTLVTSCLLWGCLPRTRLRWLTSSWSTRNVLAEKVSYDNLEIRWNQLLMVSLIVTPVDQAPDGARQAQNFLKLASTVVCVAFLYPART